MREIKFRAWSINAGRMLSDYEFGGNVHPTQDTKTSIQLRHPESIVLMQFTGLQAFGKDIFEGDILRYIKLTKNRKGETIKEESHFYEVFFDDVKCKWKIRRGETVTGLWDKVHSHAIAGNIYANPELLK